MALGDLESRLLLFHGDRAGRLQAVRLETRFSQLSRESHGEASGMCRGDQFLRIRADAVLESRRERVLRVREHSALCGYLALPILQTALPVRRSRSFHVSLL